MLNTNLSAKPDARPDLCLTAFAIFGVSINQPLHLFPVKTCVKAGKLNYKLSLTAQGFICNYIFGSFVNVVLGINI